MINFSVFVKFLQCKADDTRPPIKLEYFYKKSQAKNEWILENATKQQIFTLYPCECLYNKHINNNYSFVKKLLWEKKKLMTYNIFSVSNIFVSKDPGSRFI